MSIYPRGLQRLADLSTADLRWLLLVGGGYTFNTSHQFVADLTPGTNEATTSGYARLTATGVTVTYIGGPDEWQTTIDSPDFGALTAGETLTSIVLFDHVTSDADSPLLQHWAIADVPTETFTPLVFTVAGGVIARLRVGVP